jgi:predicted acylesterase/phospholipase RssA/ABC-type phosphate/phosphonate transport system substrate-binding protein
MKIPGTRTGLILCVMGLLLVAVSHQNVPTSRAQSEKNAPQEIKVGITEYQDIERSYERYEKLFQELMASVDPDEPVTFKFAIGNYGEVMDWYNRGDIDVGIFSAMPVANFLRDASDGDIKKFEEAYIGDVGISSVPREPLPLVTGTDEELARKDPFSYRSVCLAPASDSELGTRSDGKERTLDDIKRVQNQVKFIFVRPFSLSGYVVPLYVFKKNEINPTADQIEFSYEHSNSVQRLLDEARKKDSTKHYIACVLDEMRYPRNSDDPEKVFEKIKINDLEMDAFKIPREKIFVNYHLEKDKLPDAEGAENKFAKYKVLMKRIVERASKRAQAAGGAIKSPSSSFVVKIALRPATSDGLSSYEESRNAIEKVALPRQLPYKSTVDKLLADYAGYVDRPENEQVRTPRLALVLSGGGAKCAYQAGAIVEIESRLAELNKQRKEQGKQPVDIDLVVGTSGGAINALLVAAGVTKPDDKNDNGKNRADEIASLWGSFKQLDFFRPSGRFNLVFGICFGLLQAIMITVAVLIFGRQTMHWPATIVLIMGIGGFEVFAARYFLVSWSTIRSAVTTQAGVLAIIIVLVLFVGWIITVIVEKRWNKWRRWRWLRRRMKLQRKVVKPPVGEGGKIQMPQPLETAAHHWRWLTIVLMLGISLLEFVIANYRGFDDSISGLSDSHWMEHGWTLVRLVSSWSFPYPLVIAILMATVGAIDWNRRRETLVWFMTILLIVMAAGLMLETLFRASAPSKAEGIEQAFVQRFPELIRNTIDAEFNPVTSGDDSPLQGISRELMSRNGLQRDLIITTSRLPIDIMSSTDVSTTAEDQQRQADMVNGLPEDLYFYFRAVRPDKDEIKPPVDRRFVPFKYNSDKLLDVVIGSSTIYPIFPSRVLEDVVMGPEENLPDEKPSSPPIKKLKIIDGGFIHNIPLEAASLWKASHIILIEASPVLQQSPPRNFWDNALTAFGYLFSQAQRTDKLARGSAETFELRPTSRCEKQDVLPSCGGSESIPEPDMDTFDFSPNRAKTAFESGRNDVNVRWQNGIDDKATQKPLFVRVSGAPLFRELTPRPKAK